MYLIKHFILTELLPILFLYSAQSKNSFKLKEKSVDYVGNNRFVFNIKGNDYRLVAIILFPSLKVYIRWIGTHAEYDKTNVNIV